jgi:Pectate lyase superfamily protein
MKRERHWNQSLDSGCSTGTGAGRVSFRLTITLWVMVVAASIAVAQDQQYPVVEQVVDVTRPPYSARGDGTTDDTEALQRALNEHVGRHHVLFFPKGTYLISRTLTWPKRWNGRENWGMTMVRGENRETTVIRLKDTTFTDPSKPGAILWCGGFGSADWFHNYVENLTFDVGRGNPGAIALQFYSNNSGAVRNCRFVAVDGSGLVGLDLAHRDMNGPLLVSHCEVVGFQRGIATSHAVNSQTFEDIVLRGQSRFGLDNEGQCVSIHRLISDNEVPALRSYGTLCLVDARLNGSRSASNQPAVINYNGGRVLLRDVITHGYSRALADVRTPDWVAALRVQGEDRPGSFGPQIFEYASEKSTSPFPSPATSPRLEIKDPPSVVWEAPSKWANVDAYGADPGGSSDSSAAFQKAVDSGATTVFVPGSYRLASTVVVRGAVQRVVGLGGQINYGIHQAPAFRIANGLASAVTLEHLAYIGGGIEVDTRRTVTVRSVSDSPIGFTDRAVGAEIYLEDVVTHALQLRGQRVWARQLNIENEGLHLENQGAQLWILGYKTERGGTLLSTRDGGRSEVLGGFSYTTTSGGLAPMFVNRDSTVYTWFAEVCFNGDPFKTLIEEFRSGESRNVSRGKGGTAPYVGRRME